ncbi:MAG: glycoside hydrolase family 43 protein [Bacteroidetes bacterium]|nr:glycoside hydrolase family 43 protein [Bacteroidota bacterium]MDA1120589.1 glycoside hydrolase family 43 protein [Bacteroidota bacterium]
MNKYLSFAFTLVALSGCVKNEPDVYLFSFFQGNGEDGLHLAYSEDALNWSALNNNKSVLTPTVGGDKLMRDPCIIKGGDGKFHMVWTVSWNERGIGYANSKDLINWSEQKFIPVMQHEAGARNCWAPELFYDEENEQYLIYWATTITGRFPETDSTAESGYNHRMYYTTTQNFIDFEETRVFYDMGFNVIDATIQKANNRYVMFLKNETLVPRPEKNIRMATSTELLGNYSEATAPITTNWVEGPTAIKTEKGWVVYFDQYRDHKMGAVLSEDLEQWTDISDQIHFPDGTRHGSVLKVKQGVLDVLLTH